MTLFQYALFAGLVLLPGVPQEPQPQPPAAEPRVDRAELEKLAWISGTWVLKNGGKTTEEHWRPLQGTTLLGSSHTATISQLDGSRAQSFVFKKQ